MTFYTSLTGTRRRSTHRGASRTSVAAQQRQLRAAQKAQEARELAGAFEAILNLHRQDFPPASRPFAPPPPAINEMEIRVRHAKLATKNLGIFQRTARNEAKRQSMAGAEAEIAAKHERAAAEHREWQQYLDQQWGLLTSNHPDTVLAILEDAFEDNEAPAAAVGVESSALFLVVLVPGLEAIPERLPGVTEAGNLSLRKITKKAQAGYYTEMVAGYMLTTVREALAVAPGIAAVRVAAIRTTGLNAYGKTRVECLAAAAFTRSALAPVRWDQAQATTILNDATSDLLIKQKGAAKELWPLDLSQEPELGALLKHVDVEDLASRAN